MDGAPLPPHERTWRHPSELAAETRAALAAEPASATSRALAYVGGATGVLLIGLVVLVATPRADGTPTAVESTTIPAFGAAAPVVLTVPAGIGRPADPHITSLATPVGDDGYAFVTGAAARALAPGADLTVTLATGHEVDAELVHVGRELAVVELRDHDAVADDLPRLRPTLEVPASDEVVIVLSSPPVEVELGEIGTLDVAEGTPVVTDDGELVGLCTGDERSDRTRLIPLASELVDATAGPD